MSIPLSYEDKKMLAVYKEFYGVEYEGDTKNPDNLKTHIKAQKMVYLLSSVGIYLGEFGFSWHTNGPYSVALQNDLKLLDQNRDHVDAFYRDEVNRTLKNDEVICIKKIKKITVDKNPERFDVGLWLELLVSIFFVKKIVMPYESKEAINEEVAKRNSELMKNPHIKRAWDTLNIFESQFIGN